VPTAANGGAYIYTTKNDGRNIAGAQLTGGASGGGGGSSLASNFGGGGGGAAGRVDVYARNFIIGANATNVFITSVGGNG